MLIPPVGSTPSDALELQYRDELKLFAFLDECLPTWDELVEYGAMLPLLG